VGAVTRNERRIQKAAEAVGLKVREVHWEPIGIAMEMCGPSGGWVVFTEHPEDAICAYNVGDLLERIKDAGSQDG
jgi:hypothetical protein